MPQFGTDITPGFIVEVPDPSESVDGEGNTRTLRPPAGTEVPVKDYATGDPLDPIVLDEDGHWTYETTSATQILANITPAGPGEKWVGPIWSKQAKDNSAGAGVNASAALNAANEARQVADAAAAAVASGGGGGGGSGAQIIKEVVGSPGVYPAPTSSGPRWFYGQYEPTLAQGFRDIAYGDMWWPVVVSP